MGRELTGLATRGIFWLCFWFIVANAIAQAIRENNIGLAVFEFVGFPATYFIYPFAAHAGAGAWPLAEGTSFIPFLVVAAIAYPISTIVGGRPPVDR